MRSEVFKKITYLFLAVLDLHGALAFSSCGKVGLLSNCAGLLPAVASLAAEYGLQGGRASQVAAPSSRAQAQ